jgi:hypothetical protein
VTKKLSRDANLESSESVEDSRVVLLAILEMEEEPCLGVPLDERC